MFYLTKHIFLCTKQDLYNYGQSFKDEEGGHPAHLVSELLGGKDESQRRLHCDQLAAWYQDYATYRGLPYLFRDPSQEPR